MADIQDAIKRDNAIAEEYLLHYAEKRAAYESAKADFLVQNNTGQVPGRGNLPGKPTEMKAIRSADYDMESEEYFWLKAVEYAESMTGTRKRIFIQARRMAESVRSGNVHDTGRPSWVPYCQKKYAELTEDEWGQPDAWPHYMTMRGWWRDMISLVARVHDKLTVKNTFLI